MDRDEKIRPMGVVSTIVYWAIPAAILYSAHYVFVPWFIERTNQSYLVGYLIAWVSTMMLFFIAALAAYRAEGNPPQWDKFVERYRLNRMSRQDWLWAIAVLGFIIITYFGLSFTADWLAEWSILAPHPAFPPEFGPEGASGRAAGTFMGKTITDLAWVAIVYLFGWILNILGEEWWFRGYILPRQELAFGRFAWIANGLMFTFTHIWQPWNLLLLMPASLFAALVVQRRKNTWILIVSHGVANAALLVIIVLNAFGVAV
jgi:membrane protease YdiL (CAAX protease family)